MTANQIMGLAVGVAGIAVMMLAASMVNPTNQKSAAAVALIGFGTIVLGLAIAM